MKFTPEFINFSFITLQSKMLSIMRITQIHTVAFALMLLLFASCNGNSDCEEPEEPLIEFEPYFVSDSIRVWGDIESTYQMDDIDLRLTAGDTSSVRIFLGTLEILVFPVGEIAQTSGSEFNGSISIMDKNVDTTIAIVEFESLLEGGDNSEPCINPLIETVTLRQGNLLLYEGETRPVPNIYLTQ